MYSVDLAKCVGCGTCVAACPQQAITIVDEAAVVDQGQCDDCGRCAKICAQGAIAPPAPVVMKVPPLEPAATLAYPETQPKWLKAVGAALPAAVGIVAEATSHYLAARGGAGHRQRTNKSAQHRRRRGRG